MAQHSTRRPPVRTADPSDATREWDDQFDGISLSPETLPDLDSRAVSAVLGPIEGYQLGRRLGVGTGTEVWEAFDQAGRTWAAKLMSIGARPRHRAALAREAEVLRHLRHPGIPRFHEIGLFENRPALIRELRPGRDLAHLLRLAGALRGQVDAGPAAGRLLGAVAEACEGVQHAHDRGLLHRDLKPGNLLATTDGGGVVLDWGLALRIDERRLDTRVTAGTPGWMAPEQAQGSGTIGPSADVFSLAAVVYEILTGRSPIAGETPWERLAATADGRILPLAAGDPDGRWSPAWGALVDRALAPEPERRVPSAAAFGAGLSALLAADRRRGAPGSL